MEEENKKLFEEIKEAQKDAMITVSHWGRKGFAGTFVTKDGDMYNYGYHPTLPDSEGDKMNYIEKKRMLTSEELDKLVWFIREEIINNDYENIMMLDTGFTVSVNFLGIEKEIKNNTEIFGVKDGIYDKAKALIDEFLSK